MTMCRKCGKEVNKYKTIFGYCFNCCKKLGAIIEEKKENKR